MADISRLGNLNSPEPIDLDLYPATQQRSFPKKGRYTVRAPERIGDEAFSRSQAGYLQAQIDPTIVGPTHSGYVIKFCRVSARPFQRRVGRGKDERTIAVSQMADYLRACGVTGVLPTNPQDLATLVERTAGATYLVDIDWKARNPNTGVELQGMEKFPVDPDTSEHLPWFVDDNDIDPETQEKRRVRAYLKVKRFVAP